MKIAFNFLLNANTLIDNDKRKYRWKRSWSRRYLFFFKTIHKIEMNKMMKSTAPKIMQMTIGSSRADLGLEITPGLPLDTSFFDVFTDKVIPLEELVANNGF